MINLKFQKPGMRNIKSGIGVMICILVSYVGIINNTFFASMGCIVAMQTTLKGSLISGLNRVKGTLVGGSVGLLLSLIDRGNPILACIGIITSIYICNILDMNDSIVITCVLFCVLYLDLDTVISDPINYALYRTVDTSMGVFVGVLVNYYIYRPDYIAICKNQVESIKKLSIELLIEYIENNERKNISILREKMWRLNELYNNLLIDSEYDAKLDIEKMYGEIEICNQIYLHLQILEKIEGTNYLSQSNYKKYKYICDCSNKELQIKNDESIIFNYHLKMILDNIIKIEEIESMEESKENFKKVVSF